MLQRISRYAPLASEVARRFEPARRPRGADAMVAVAEAADAAEPTGAFAGQRRSALKVPAALASP